MIIRLHFAILHEFFMSERKNARPEIRAGVGLSIKSALAMQSQFRKSLSFFERDG